jgi:hypothetical protein
MFALYKDHGHPPLSSAHWSVILVYVVSELSHRKVSNKHRNKTIVTGLSPLHNGMMICVVFETSVFMLDYHSCGYFCQRPDHE